MRLLLAAACLTGLIVSSATAVDLRVATYNSSLSPGIASGTGSLVSNLSTPNDLRAQRVAEIVQRIDPDILLINEFNWDSAGQAADSFSNSYLSVGRDAAATGTISAPISFPYRYLPTGVASPFNTGIPSGKDLNNDGITTGPDDAFGFGQFPGQYGMVVYSKYPIKTDEVRTFQQFLWKDMPDNLIPPDYYSTDEEDVLRLSSKSHWDVPVDVNGETVHVLVSHPTPPVFDGAEDRNGRRNNDEIRFWRDYITPGDGDYIYDDQEFAAAGGVAPVEPRGGLAAGGQFVILGDQNADPVDGDGYPGAVNQLLSSSRINTSLVPTSTGGPQAAVLQGGANNTQVGNPANDTAAFGSSGNLRADYVLPSADLQILDGHVFWFGNTDPLFGLVTHGSFPSDHRAVYVDVRLPLAGDYNGDGIVNAADYTVWRNTLGSDQDLRADGNSDQMIDQEDYFVWKSHFGETAASGTSENAAGPDPVPEPSTRTLLVLSAVGCAHWWKHFCRSGRATRRAIGCRKLPPLRTMVRQERCGGRRF
jgi:3-phytase